MRERGYAGRSSSNQQSYNGGSSTCGDSKGSQQPQQKANVQFNANFESGNIGEVTQLSENEYDIKIRPDTNNNRHRLWFYFSVSNIRPRQQGLPVIHSIAVTLVLYHQHKTVMRSTLHQVLLNIVNFSKTKSLYREGLSPVVCSRRRPQWNRIPSSQVLYYRSPKGPGNRMAYVMSFLFEFDGANDAPYYFAYAFPYTYTDLQRYLYSLERQDLPFLRREALSRTLQQRRIELLTITAPEGEPGARPLQGRKWVFMSARVHPGETPAQFIMHGVIDFLTGESPRARALRANVVFKIVPMLNPDGVVNGNYRCSYLGFDLNRHWLEPSAWAQPEILSVKTLVAKLHEDPSVDLDFYVDIHAHSVGTNSFMYGNNIPARRKEGTATGGASPPLAPTQASSQQRQGSPHADTGSSSPRTTPAPTWSSSTVIARQPHYAAPDATATIAAARGRVQEVERPPGKQHALLKKGGGGGGGGDGKNSSGEGDEGGRSSSSSKTSGGTAGGGGTEVGPGTDEDEEELDPLGGALVAFPRMLAVNAPDFSFAQSRFDADPSKEGTGRRALGQLLSPDVLCFTLEVSFYASHRDGVGLVPYTRAGYVELGRSLASTFFDYYKLGDVGGTSTTTGGGGGD